MKLAEIQKRLEHRFITLWKRNGGTKEGGQEVFAALAARYNEPHRAYHTLEHIHSCLGIFDRFSKCAADEDQVEVAIFFHDVVYDIGVPAGQNEERSADFADLHLYKAEFFDNEHVRKLILATKHDKAVSGPDEMLIVDIDLAGLGQPWKIFLKNNRNVRTEYKHVSEEDFRKGNGAILGSFLQKTTLYYFAPIEEIYGNQARQNLTTWLSRP